MLITLLHTFMAVGEYIGLYSGSRITRPRVLHFYFFLLPLGPAWSRYRQAAGQIWLAACLHSAHEPRMFFTFVRLGKVKRITFVM